jgi:LysM repeat protein
LIQRRLVHTFLSLIFIAVILSGPSVFGNENPPVVKNIEFVNADLRDVFRSLAAAGKFTIIIEPRVHGNVTLALRYGVTVKDAVSVIAKTYGYSCRWLTDSPTALVGSTQFIQINFDQKVSKVYQLKYAKAKDLAESLEVVIPKTRIKTDLQKNQIIVLANEIEITNIKELIGKLDREFQPIDFNIQMEEVPNAIWNKLGIANKYQPPHMGVYILKEQQMKAIAEIAPNLITESNFSGLDNHPLKIFMGDKIPLIITKKRKGDLNYQVEYIDTGTAISFIPQLNSEHQLTVAMGTTVSTVANKSQPGTKWIPWVVNRDFQSTIRLEVGQTILLSGLLQRNEYEMMKKSPYCFPELDKLFASQKHFDQAGPNMTTEVIALITPRLADKNSLHSNEAENVPASSVPTKTIAEESAGNANLPSDSQTQAAGNNSLSPSLEGKLPIDEDKPEIKISLESTKENSSQDKQKPDESTIVSDKRKSNSKFTEIHYHVKKGDTIISIVRKFATNLELVKAKNNLNSTGTIREDLILIIPVPSERIYELKRKETLWRIAKRYGTTLEVLKDLNGISDETKVNAGQLVVLPRANSQIVNSQF